MKCKYCDGDGVIVDAEYGHAGKYMCGNCDGTGVVEPLTNEEYMQTCSSDELANTIFRLIVHGTVIRPDREYIKRWLKEKRHD